MQIKIQKYLPSADLRPYISFYYTISFDEGEHQIQFDNHPQGTMDMMFVLEGSASFGKPERGNQPLRDIFFIGQQMRNFTFRFAPHVRAVGVTFTAEGFAKVFQVPMKTLTNSGVEAMDLLEKEDRFLLERIVEMDTDEARFLLLNDIFSRKIYANDLPFDAVDAAIRSIRESGGQPGIAELATEFNMSARTLQRKFGQKIGVSPKTYARVMRFNYMLRILKSLPEVDWQEVLYRSGYYDQMHFIKEFKQFTGQTPTQYIHRENALRDFFLDSR